MQNEGYPEFFEIKDACRLLGISRPTLTQLLTSGSLKGFRIGKKKWKIPRASIESFIEEQCDIQARSENRDV